MVGADEVARLAVDLVGPGASVTVEGAGWDHVAWRVVGADGVPWIVRAPVDGEPEAMAADVHREVAVMQRARLVLGDLVGDAVVLEESRGCLAHPRLPGTPLQDLLVAGRLPAAARDEVAREVGAVIADITRLVPPAGVPVDHGLPAWLAAAPELVAQVEHVLTIEEQAAVARFVAMRPPPAPWPEDLPVTHNDLGAEHVLVDPGTLAVTGVVDWSDAARADPAGELGRLARDLGGEHLDAVLDGMAVAEADRPALTARAWCYARCLVLEDLAYALRRRPDLVAFERASLAVLFADC